LIPKGYINVQVKYNGQCESLRLYVVQKGGTALFGIIDTAEPVSSSILISFPFTFGVIQIESCAFLFFTQLIPK
jgi:hypothetical protein